MQISAVSYIQTKELNKPIFLNCIYYTYPGGVDVQGRN